VISTELLVELHKLSPVDKLHVIQLLAHDLASQEVALIHGATYDIWSPYDAPQAADTLLKMLETEQDE
jgi:hypothetical protein